MHQYIVFKNYQVLPVYVVEYVIDIYKHQQSKTPVCDNCDKTVPELAKFYCQKEDAYFCNECDNKCHDSKLAKTHQRVDVSEKPKKFGYCSSHQLVEL